MVDKNFQYCSAQSALDPHTCNPPVIDLSPSCNRDDAMLHPREASMSTCKLTDSYEMKQGGWYVRPSGSWTSGLSLMAVLAKLMY